MAKVYLVYGPRGAGKTRTTVRLGEAVAKLGFGVGGFYQRVVHDELDRRGYDLVSMHDSSRTVPIARPGGVRMDGEEQAGLNAVCSFSFSEAALAEGRGWLESDALVDRVLVLDEISKLEVRGFGHSEALRWALGLGDDVVLLLSVRGDQLYYVVEEFGLEELVLGYLEIPVGEEEFLGGVREIVAWLGGDTR